MDAGKAITEHEMVFAWISTVRVPVGQCVLLGSALSGNRGRMPVSSGRVCQAEKAWGFDFLLYPHVYIHGVVTYLNSDWALLPPIWSGISLRRRRLLVVDCEEFQYLSSTETTWLEFYALIRMLERSEHYKLRAMKSSKERSATKMAARG
jgi:hypothetical protein